jgi:hypothetical protein
LRLPVATHDGFPRLGKWTVHAYNLSDGRRVFDKASFKEVIAIPPTESGTGILRKIASHPLLRSNPLSGAASAFERPVRFKLRTDEQKVGFEAEALIEICRFLLKAREIGALRSNSELRYAQAAESLLVSMANVGLAALIDEATGFQEVRSRDALQALLERYLNKELAAWAKRFPDEFYIQLYRLKGWAWRGRSVNPPQVVGRYTRDIVYGRLAPGIVEELERRNPICESGGRLNKHHQWLTDEVGHPALAQHLHAVIALMRISTTWQRFTTYLQDAFPLKGDQFSFGFED